MKKLILTLLLIPFLASATTVPWERTVFTGHTQGTTSPLFQLDEARFNTFKATSTTATSTIAGGLVITGGGAQISNLINCNGTNTLDTDGNGNIVCGTDATGGTGSNVDNVIYALSGGTTYYVASSTATDNLSWRFNNGFVSNASSTVASTLTVTGATILNGISYTWPTSQSASTCLQTNGSGVLSWATCGSGGGNYDAFTHPKVGESATTTILNMAGFNTTGSSTINSTLQIGSNIIPIVNGGGTLGNASLAFASLSLKDTTSAFGGTIQMTNTGAGGWQVLTLDIGNYSPTLTFQGAAGNPTLGDWFDQNVKTTGTPTFAKLLVTGLLNASTTVLGQNFISYASSTIAGALNVSGTTGFNGIVYTWPASQAATRYLQTDGSGGLSWVTCATITGSAGLCDGDDATGGAGGNVDNVIYLLTGGTNYYVASSTATNNLSWRFNNGFVSNASSTATAQLNVNGVLNASSTGLFGTGLTVYAGNANLLGGATITCTGCITDVNVADIALGGGTSGNYVRTIADSGNSTITVANSGAEDADVTLNVIDVNCTDCLGATEITDVYILNNADDSTTGKLTIAGGLVSQASSTFSQGLIIAGLQFQASSTALVQNLISYASSTFSTSLNVGTTFTCTACVTNADLANSTISGIALGSNLSALTNGLTLNGSSYNGSGAISDWDINLANSNIWTASTTFPILNVGQTLHVENINASSTATSTFRGGIAVNSIGGLSSGSGLTISGGNINFAGDSISDLVGTGLQITTGALTLNATGDWTGTLDSIDGASFLRSDASDSYTSGTLTFDAGTTLSIVGTFNNSSTATSTFAGGIKSNQGFEGMFVEAGILRLGTGTATSTLKYGVNYGGQITIATTTNGSVLLASGNKTLWATSIASTTIDLTSGFNRAGSKIPLPAYPWATNAHTMYCAVWAGTNVAVRIQPVGKVGNTITCTTTSTSTGFSINSNGNFAAGTGGELEIVSASGSSDWLWIRIIGTSTPL